MIVSWVALLLRDLFVVFLTNRSLGRTIRSSLEAMRSVRAKLSDAVGLAVRARCVADSIVGCSVTAALPGRGRSIP